MHQELWQDHSSSLWQWGNYSQQQMWVWSETVCCQRIQRKSYQTCSWWCLSQWAELWYQGCSWEMHQELWQDHSSSLWQWGNYSQQQMWVWSETVCCQRIQRKRSQTCSQWCLPQLKISIKGASIRVKTIWMWQNWTTKAVHLIHVKYLGMCPLFSVKLQLLIR